MERHLETRLWRRGAWRSITSSKRTLKSRLAQSSPQLAATTPGGWAALPCPACHRLPCGSSQGILVFLPPDPAVADEPRDLVHRRLVAFHVVAFVQFVFVRVFAGRNIDDRVAPERKCEPCGRRIGFSGRRFAAACTGVRRSPPPALGGGVGEGAPATPNAPPPPDIRPGYADRSPTRPPPSRRSSS